MSLRLDQALRELLETELEEFGVPGGAAQVTVRGEVRRAVAGIEALSSGRPIGFRSRFAIGSISKIPTIAVVLSLMAERGMGVDTSLRKLLPDLELARPGIAENITVHHLLTHSSGLQSDHFPDLPFGDDMLQQYVQSCVGIGELHRPGERFSYCNSGFILLGAIAERLAGQPWHQLLRDRVLHPLGMADTRIGHGGDCDEPVRGHAVHPATGQLAEVPFWLPAPVGPCGLIFTTAADLTRFMQAVMPDRPGHFGAVPDVMAGPGIVTPPGHALLGSQRWLPGWAEWNLDGLRVLGYDGCIGSQCSAVRIIPEEDFTAVVMTNALAGEWTIHEVLDRVFTEQFGVGVPRIATPETADHEPLPDYAVYERHGARVVLEHDGGTPLLSLKFSGDIADWTALEFDRAPLRPVGGRLWTVQLARGDREVAFDGPMLDGAPMWLHFEVQAHRLSI